MGTEDVRGSGRTILVVDDWEGVRDVAQAALELDGYRVRTASTGEDALRILEDSSSSIAAVVMDLGLPAMSGEEALHAIRNDHADLPVVLMSGNPEIESKALLDGDLGPHAFLEKPFLPADIRQRVAALLG